MNKISTAVGGGLLALASAIGTPSTLAGTIDLTGLPFVTYGDGQSYSLPISQALGCTTCEVMAGPGQIDIYTKLGLQSQLGNSTPGMDDAFDTPSANNTDGFRMGAGNEPTPTFTGDRVGWWDTTLTALNSKVDLFNNSMVFFFANNETGGGDNLAGYARIELTGPGGVLVPGGRFELTNDFNHDGVAPYGAFTSGGGIPNGNPAAYTSLNQAPVVADFLQSGGEVCVPIPPTNAIQCFQHNLGGDRAAYAVVFPELNALIAGLILGGADLSQYALHVEYRLGCGPESNTAQGSPSFPQVPAGGGTECDPNYAINGGSEKVFIGTQALTTSLPVPSSLLLAGIALLGLGYARRRNSII